MYSCITQMERFGYVYADQLNSTSVHRKTNHLKNWGLSANDYSHAQLQVVSYG